MQPPDRDGLKRSWPGVPGLIYGADYNPEQWPEEVWAEDARLMEQAGVNLVSLAIFSWARLEPRPNQYDFDWLDRLMDLLYRHKVRVNLATATASPPAWLSRLDPASLPQTVEGVRLGLGARQHFCPSNPTYRQAAARLVRQMAERYRHHPALVMWHINNEYGCHVAECYCPVSAAAFRDWLRHRYGTIEELNRAWGTTFWSQHYAGWDEIEPPRRAPTFVNPHQQLDFRRFSSDALLECFEQEKQILEEVTPDLPVTTNFMGFFKPLDYWKWAAREDLVSHDSYPDPANPISAVDAAMTYDLIRSLGQGRPWLVMEQAASQVNWRAQNALKRPGQMRFLSYQALAHGADGLMFFQWRASLAGAEKFHSAMLPHAGPASRTWREVLELGGELARLVALRGSRVKSPIAIIFDWDNWWALELDSKPSQEVKQMAQLRSYYYPLFKLGLTPDYVPPGADLSGYRLVLIPNLYLVSDENARRLENFVEQGGTLVISFFSGLVDEYEHIRPGPYPAAFRRLLGLRVEEFDPFQAGQSNAIRTGDGEGEVYQCSLWADLVELEGATGLAHFEADFYAGRVALAVNQFGQGQAYYLATNPEAAYVEKFLGQLCHRLGIAAALDVPPGVEAVARQAEQGHWLFVLNHNLYPVEIELKSAYQNALQAYAPVEQIRLEAYDVAVLWRPRA